MKTQKFLAASVIGLVALGLAGCGSDSNSPAATIPADAGLVVYAGPGIKFDKTEYTAKAGVVKVAFENRDAQRHSFDIVDSNKKVLPGELVVGKSGDLDVGDYTLADGTYKIVCLIPGHDAMKATLTVSG